MAQPNQQNQAAQQAPKPQPSAQRMGFDATRPLRYGWSATKGSVGGLLDGMSSWGRKGAWVGVGLGLLMGMAGTFSVGLILGMAVTGLATGAVAGAGIGFISGGTSAVGRAHRREKYADELAERKAARAEREARTQQAAPVQTGPSWRDRVAYQRAASTYNFDRALQQAEENERDFESRWQDRVSQGTDHNQQRGF